MALIIAFATVYLTLFRGSAAAALALTQSSATPGPSLTVSLLLGAWKSGSGSVAGYRVREACRLPPLRATRWDVPRRSRSGVLGARAITATSYASPPVGSAYVRRLQLRLTDPPGETDQAADIGNARCQPLRQAFSFN